MSAETPSSPFDLQLSRSAVDLDWSRDAIRLRIWERGTGPTLASGSCSCAAAVAAVRRGLTDRRVRVEVPGGVLVIDWREDGVWMEGPTALVFEGRLTREWLAA